MITTSSLLLVSQACKSLGKVGDVIAKIRGLRNGSGCEDFLAIAQCGKISRRYDDVPQIEFLDVDANWDDFLRFRDAGWIQQQCVDCAENRGVPSDPERERLIATIVKAGFLRSTLDARLHPSRGFRETSNRRHGHRCGTSVHQTFPARLRVVARGCSTNAESSLQAQSSFPTPSATLSSDRVSPRAGPARSTLQRKPATPGSSHQSGTKGRGNQHQKVDLAESGLRPRQP